MTYLPGRSDYRALGKSLGIVAWLLLVAWWLYPLIFVCTFFYWCYKVLEWTIKEIAKWR